MIKNHRTSKLLATVAAGTLVFTACGSDEETPGDDPVEAPVDTDVVDDMEPVDTDVVDDMEEDMEEPVSTDDMEEDMEEPVSTDG